MNSDERSLGTRQFALGAVILAAAAALGHDAARNAELMADFGADPGPSFQPLLMLYLLAAAGVILIVRGVVRLARTGWRVSIPRAAVESLVFPVLMIVSLLAYVGLVEVIGFLAVSLVLNVSWAAVLVAQDFGLREPRRLILGAGGAAVVTVAIYLVFRQVIGVPLD